MHPCSAFHCLRLALARAVLVVLLGQLGVALAAPSTPEPAWARSKFDYVAQKQDLRQVLRDFARDMRIQVDIADEVSGRVTGKFDMAPGEMLDLLGAYHHFVWFYDGSVLYVGSSLPGAPKLRRRSDVAAATAPAPAAASAAPASAASAASATSAKAGATPAIAAAASPAAAPALPSWNVLLQDGTLSTTFTRWAEQAGWQLLWEMPLDYKVDASTQVEGTFEQAVEAIANSLADGATPMRAIFYKGNHVIRIVSKGTP